MPWFRRRRRDGCPPERKPRAPIVDRLKGWLLGKVWAWIWPKLWPWGIAIVLAVGAWFFRDAINKAAGVKPTQVIECDCHRWGRGRPCCERCNCCERE